jgi:hypothetical protein
LLQSRFWLTLRFLRLGTPQQAQTLAGWTGSTARRPKRQSSAHPLPVEARQQQAVLVELRDGMRVLHASVGIHVLAMYSSTTSWFQADCACLLHRNLLEQSVHEEKLSAATLDTVSKQCWARPLRIVKLLAALRSLGSSSSTVCRLTSSCYTKFICRADEKYQVVNHCPRGFQPGIWVLKA